MKFRYSLSILAIIWVHSCIAQTHPEYYQMATLAKAQVDYSGACKMLTKAIELAPYEEKYFLERGYVYLGLERYSKALDDFNSALRIDSMSVDPWIGRSKYFLYSEQPDSALMEASIAHILSDHKYSRAKATSALGEVYYHMGKDSLALAYFSESLLLDTTNTPGYKKAAEICLEREDFDLAKRYLLKAFSNDSKDLAILVNLAYTYNQLGYHREAIEYCNLALAFDPNQPLALSNRAFSYYHLEQRKRALEDINMSLKNDATNPLSYLYKAEILIALEESNKKACKCLEKAIKFGYTALYDLEAEQLQAQHCSTSP